MHRREFCCHCRRFWPMLGLHESCMAFLICLQRQTLQVMHVLHSKLLIPLRYTTPRSCITILPMSFNIDLGSHTKVDLHAQQPQKHYWVLGPGSNVQYVMTCQLKMVNSLEESWLDISCLWDAHNIQQKHSQDGFRQMCSLLQGCTKQAVTVLRSVASTASPVILLGGNESSSRHVQPVLSGDALPQAANDWLKQKSQQHVASSHLLSSSTAESTSTTDMATAAMPPAIQVWFRSELGW